MLRKTLLFAGLGFVWLFLYSIPLGQGKNVYNIAHYYIVDTRPVHWIISKVHGGYTTTIEATDVSTVPAAYEKMNERLSKTEKSLENAEY